MRALAGGIGLVAGLVSCAIAAAGLLVALGMPAEGRADDPPPTTTVAPEPRPTELVVALGLGDPVLRQAWCATARSSSRVASRSTSPAISPSASAFPAFASSTSSRRRGCSSRRCVPGTSRSPRSGRVGAASASADLSDPYLGTDQAVVLRRGLRGSSTLGDLRRKITCAVRGSDGARAIAGSVRPFVKPILAPSHDAAARARPDRSRATRPLVDADSVGQFVAGRGGILGPVSAKVERGGGYVVAVTRGGPIAVSEVDRALARMRADGTVGSWKPAVDSVISWRNRLVALRTERGISIAITSSDSQAPMSNYLVGGKLAFMRRPAQHTLVVRRARIRRQVRDYVLPGAARRAERRPEVRAHPAGRDSSARF